MSYKIWVEGKEKNLGRGTIWSKIVEKGMAVLRPFLDIDALIDADTSLLRPLLFPVISPSPPAEKRLMALAELSFQLDGEMAVLFVRSFLAPFSPLPLAAGRLTACSAAPFFGRFQRAAFSMRKAACP